MQNKLKWTKTCFSSCYCSCNLFQATQIKRSFTTCTAC